jgi:hypothetical protein
VKVGAKSGYINTKGVVAITPQFDDALQFQYGRATVKLCCGPGWQENGTNRFGLIGKDGRYIGSPNFLWIGSFSGDLAPVMTADGVLAFVDRSGKIVLSGKCQSLLTTGFTAGLAPAAFAGKWGFIDTAGKWAIDPQYEGARNFADGLAPVIVGGRTGYIDKKGGFVVNPQYEPGDEFYEGFAGVASGGKAGFIDTAGRVVVSQNFLGVGHFSDGLAPVQTEEGWGFIDRTGKLVISPQFDTAEAFQNGLARVTISGKEAYVTTAGAYVVDPFPGRSATPAHAVQEIWEGDVKISEKARHHERLILIREGTKIWGYHAVTFGANQPTKLIDLKGQAAQDGSFSMADEDGASWKGRFVSPVLIKGVAVNWRWGPPERSANEYPALLRLAHDATASEVPEPLPPTSPDWSSFLSAFKDAVQRRDSGVLAGMMARDFMLQSESFRTPAEALAHVKWDELDRTLARGAEKPSSTPWGKALHLIVDEHPCPNCVFQIAVIFSQGGDNQWRWAGVEYPGD